MKLRNPDHVQAFTDRHGKARYYFRKPGMKRVPLPGLPWTPQFMAAYELALAGEAPKRFEVGSGKTLPGTINALAVAYFNSGEFKALSPNTQGTYRGIIEHFRATDKNGDKRVATLETEHIARMMSEKAQTPAAANNLLRMIRLLMKFAVRYGLRAADPTIGLKPLKMRSEGFYTWTEDDIAAFEGHHAIGTRARLAFGLLLYTAQRRGDVVRMGRQHVKTEKLTRTEKLTIKQRKTGQLVSIPILPALREILNASQNNHLTFLVTSHGKSFTSDGFGNWFRSVCDEASLPMCSAHGLRKAAARRLAEAGCSAHQIMAITGHKTLREVTRYTLAYDRQGQAEEAFAKLERRTAIVKLRHEV